jgi:hypothetical protein
VAAAERAQDIVRRGKRQSVAGVLQFPRDLGAHCTLMIFDKYQYNAPGERELNKIGSSGYNSQLISGREAIILPLPSNIEDTYSIRVQGYDAEISGEAVARAASGFAGAGDISLGNLSSSLRAALPDFNWDGLLSGNTEDISKNVAFVGRRTAENLLPGAARAISTGIGNAINPKASLYFDGVNLKQPNFTWNLSPLNPEDSDSLKNIINLVKKNILPSYSDAVGLPRALLNYPSVVDIFFLGIDQSYFLYYKTCMVQSFSTNFTPNGLTILRGGKPASVTINMSLIETDIHTSENYDGTSTESLNVLSLMRDPNGPGAGK